MKVIFQTDEEMAPNEIAVAVRAQRQTDTVNEVIKHLEGFQAADNTLLIKDRTKKAIISVFQRDISAVEVFGDFISIYANNQQFEERERLYKVKELLNATTFVQVSKSVIINLDYLDHLDLNFTGMVFVKLSNGAQYTVTRTYYKELKERMGQLHGNS